MNTNTIEKINKFSEINHYSKTKLLALVEEILAAEKQEEHEENKREKIVDKVEALAAKFETFTITEAAERLICSWMSVYNSVKELERQGKLVVAGQVDKGLRGKKEKIWAIAA